MNSLINKIKNVFELFYNNDKLFIKYKNDKYKTIKTKEIIGIIKDKNDYNKYFIKFLSENNLVYFETLVFTDIEVYVFIEDQSKIVNAYKSDTYFNNNKDIFKNEARLYNINKFVGL